MPRVSDRLFPSLLIGVLSLAFSACPRDSSEPIPEGKLPFKEARSAKARESNPKLSKDEQAELRRGNIDFGFKLLEKLDEDHGNLAVSAVSLRQVFGMVHAMARGETRQEITDTFGFLQDPKKTYTGLNLFDQALQSRNLGGEREPTQDDDGTDDKDENDKPLFIQSSNRLLFQEGMAPGSEFLDILAKHFGTGVSIVDFNNNAAQIEKDTNAWIAHRTRDRIPQLIPKDQITEETTWLLINAIYFKARWAFKWIKTKTAFTTLDKKEVNVPTLKMPAMFSAYGEDDKFRWATAPLVGRKLAFMVFLPTQADKFLESRKALTGGYLQQMLADPKTGLVHLEMPQFKIKTESMDLSASLKSMGMPLAFSESDADLSGFNDKGDARDFIKFVLHQVFFAVDQHGIEAAAASVVGGTKKSAGKDKDEKPEPFVLKLDRPFYFAVIDRPTGLALFTGQVTDPRS